LPKRASNTPHSAGSNKGDGAALSLVTSKERAPFTVYSQVKVNGLNADRVDGLDSSQLVRSDQQVDADTLNGKGCGAFVGFRRRP
jgi:hypothetical protein